MLYYAAHRLAGRLSYSAAWNTFLITPELDFNDCSHERVRKDAEDIMYVRMQTHTRECGASALAAHDYFTLTAIRSWHTDWIQWETGSVQPNCNLNCKNVVRIL